MVEQVYKWKRFWCPRSSNINLGDRGYLFDPDSKWGHHYNPDLVSFESIAKLPCLVLLGEPGIGKTHAIETELNNLIDKGHKKGHAILELNLRSCSDEGRLIRKLFESKTFIDWVNGTHYLHIFLDSLDECLLRIDTLATLLVDEFKEYRDNLARVYLCITCRTAIFPKVLEEGLEELFGKNSLGIYELVPLRRADVIEATKAQGLDSDTFLEEVDRKGVVPFAIKPITLKFLLNTYQRYNGKFPPEQKLSDLYLDGCRELCEEPNLSRRASGKLINFEVEQRLIVAARIAAVTIFANRFAIWTELEQGNVPDEDVLLRTLSWGSESANGREFQVSEAAVKETLDTGLFSSRGANRMGWVHQTYAEFLAAWYLKQHKLKLPQMMNLIIHADDPERRIVPQLHETVAWLAGMVLEVFNAVMKTDPDILLQSDIATTSEVDRAALVESLLKLYDEDKLVYQHRSWLYENLKHSELPNQLQPYICDLTKSIYSRYVAIDIAESCNVQTVQESLVEVALDVEQPQWVRMRAARAVGCIGSEESKARLKPLAVGEAGNDPEDEIKGCALKALYPNYITAEEVFNILTQPKANYIGGRYQDFIAREIGQHLKFIDLPIALGWLEKQPTRRGLGYPFDKLSDEIILKAWEHLEEPIILKSFAKITLIRLKKHDKIIDSEHNPSFKEQLEKDDNKRRLLIEAIISGLPESEHEPLWLCSYSKYSTAIILEQDFFWMIERCEVPESERTQKIYAKLINRKLNKNNPKQVNELLTASQNNSVLQAEFSSLLEPIELDSLRAENEKAKYLEYLEMLNYNNSLPLLEPSPKERVITALSWLESGQINTWCNLCQEMTLMPTSTHYNEVYDEDLTKLPGWEEAEEITKKRIIAAAKAYIYHGDPQNSAWLGTNSFLDSALYGYKALRLILLEDPDFLSTIPNNIWEKWTPIIIDYPNSGGEKDKEYRKHLINKAYQNAPDEFIRTLIILIDQENEQHGVIFITDKIKHCWDERLGRVLLDKLKDEKLTAKSLGYLLKDLLINQVNKAKAFAESLIPLPPPSVREERAKAIVAAEMLMLYAEDAGWSVLWSVIQQDPEFGREVMEFVSYSIKYEGSVEQRLKEECIADLYIFLTKEYSDAKEKQQKNSQYEEITGVKAYVVEPEDSIKTWRDYIPQRLQERGTPEACEALRKIIGELPELKDKLQWRLLEAEALARRQTWKPRQPEEILQIVSNQINVQSTQIQAEVLIMQNPNNPNLNFNAPTGAVNINSTVYGDQIGEQNNYAPERNLGEAFDEIQQIINRLTQNYPTINESEKQIVVDQAVNQVKQNPTLMKRLRVAGQAFTFEALQKASDQWWVSPFVKAIEAAIKSE